ncbi:MAG: phage/plasmid primase, P4 family [Rhodospirillaceae bacterium]
MRDHDYTAAADFLADFFGSTTEHAVELRSLPNERGAGPNRPLFGRDLTLVDGHCQRWDGPGRAMYFGTFTRVTGSPSGTRADLAECPALWAEVDTRKLGLEKTMVRQAVTSLPHPPSIVIDSGGGLHFYWLLTEAISVRADDPGAAETEESIVAVLKQLAGIMAGDTSVCDLARIMRLPGSHNTKPEVMATNADQPALVTVLAADWQRRHEFSDLVEWLDWQRPVIMAPIPPEKGKADDNPYLAAAARLGFKPPLDVEKALAAMSYLGNGDSGIHQTQLRVSASLVSQGVEDDEIVTLLMATTMRAAGLHARTWNWRREERSLRTMIATARTKFVRPVEKPVEKPVAAPKSEPTDSGDPAASPEPKKKRTRKGGAEPESEGALIARLGEAVISYWLKERGPLIVIAGDPWTYRDGYWRLFDATLHHSLRVAVQGVIASAGVSPVTSLLNAVHRYVIERPSLNREEVPWDSSGYIVGRNGAIHPETGAIIPHSPELYATSRIEANFDPAATCPIWLSFLEAAFADLAPEEAAKCISTLAEIFGSFLIRRKRRELTKALLVIGPTRTGKSQVAYVARGLVGGKPSGIRAVSLTEHFGVEPLLGASAWVADDAVKENEFLDAEWFKVIVDGAPISVPRKNQQDWTGCLDIPVLLTANHMPRVKDQSGAVYNRALIMRMTVQRAEEDPNNRKIAEEIIEGELGGVFNWAITGWKRLSARRHFAPPPVMLKAMKTYVSSNSPVATWMEAAVEQNPAYMVDRRDLIASFNGWFSLEAGAEAKPLGARALFPAMRSVLPHVDDYKSGAARYLAGVRLTEEGLETWQLFLDSKPGSGFSPNSRFDVNRPAPPRKPAAQNIQSGEPATKSKTVF